MANVNSYKHGLIRNFVTKLHTPKVTSKFGVHLSDDIQENTIIVSLDCSVSYKLRNDRAVTVDLIFQKRVKVLMVSMVRHDDQKDELGVFNRTT